MAAFIIYLAFLVVFSMAVVWTPSLGIAALTFVFALDQWSSVTSQDYISDQAFTNYAVGGIVIVALLVDLSKRLSEKTEIVHVGIIYFLSALLFLYAYLSKLWIATPYTWIAQISNKHNPDFLWSWSLPYILLFSFAAPFLVRTQRDIIIIGKSLVIIGLPLVGLFLFNIELSNRMYIIEGTLERFNPLEMARLGGILAIASACLFRESKTWKFLCIAGIVLGFGLILKSETRGQTISTILCVTLIFLLSYGRISSFSMILKVMFSFVVLFSIYLILTIDSVTDFLELLIDTRVTTGEGSRFSFESGARAVSELRWEPAMRVVSAWLDSPVSIIFGLGSSASYAIMGNHPHNVPLEIMAELGLLGLGLYLTIIFLVLRRSLYILSLVKIPGFESRALWIFPFLALFEFIGSLKELSLILAWYLFAMLFLVERVASICSSQIAKTQGHSQQEVTPFDAQDNKGPWQKRVKNQRQNLKNL